MEDVAEQVLMGLSDTLGIKVTATHYTTFKIDGSEGYGPFKIPSPKQAP